MRDVPDVDAAAGSADHERENQHTQHVVDDGGREDDARFGGASGSPRSASTRAVMPTEVATSAVPMNMASGRP